MTIKTGFVTVLLLATSGAAYAQQAAKTPCPSLPAGSDLTWVHKAGAGRSDFCRAIRPDGTEAFVLYLASDSPFDAKRSARAEQSTIDGQEIYWYRSELPLPDGAVAREAQIPLRDGRVGHIWIQADSEDQLRQTFRQTESLRFPAARLSSN